MAMSRSTRRNRFLVGALLGTLGFSCTPPEEPFPNDGELEQLRSLHSPTQRPPPDPTNKYGDDSRAVALGSRLFEDPLLSSCGTVSCKSCHDGEGMTVPTAVATGCDGNKTGRNPPTVLGSGYAVWFMWDGRADRLWNQVLLPLTSPLEMNSNATILRNRLAAAYAPEYQAIFGQHPSQEGDDVLLANFSKVLAAYERTLNRNDAPFDADVIRFIKAAEQGKAELDPAHLGLKTFFRKGQCIACHKGPMLTDDLFHNIGVKDASDGRRGVMAAAADLLAWAFNSKGPHSDSRDGLEAGRLQRLDTDIRQKPEELEGAFKTPSLRNVALTAPYMHTGEVATLEDVVELYDKGGDPKGSFVGVVADTIQPLELTADEKKALVKLMESMTGAK
jgi:cytochrome c peroxidase